MNVIYRLFVVGLCCLFSSFVAAGLPNKTVEKLLSHSGVTQQLEQLPDMVQGGLMQAKQQGSPIAEEDFHAFVDVSRKHFSSGSLNQKLRQVLKKSLKKKEAKKILAWYDSDLGKRITAEELNASSMEAYQAMMQSPQKWLGDEARSAFTTRLDKILGVTDMSLAVQNSVGMSVFSAFSLAAEPEKPVNLDQIRAHFDSQSVQMRMAAEQMTLISGSYAYRNIPLEDLSQYEVFLNTEHAMKFNKLLVSNIQEWLVQLSDDWATELVDVLVKNKNQQGSEG